MRTTFLSQLIVAFGIFLIIVAVIVEIPSPRLRPQTVVEQLCRQDRAVVNLASQPIPQAPTREDYARGAAVAIVAIEMYNRPAIWRLAKEVVFDAMAWTSPRIAQATIGPAQMSRAFFEREIAPLVPDATFPESVLAPESARNLIRTWIEARLAKKVPANSAAKTYAFELGHLFEIYNGSRDPEYRMVALRIALDHCRSDSTPRDRPP